MPSCLCGQENRRPDELPISIDISESKDELDIDSIPHGRPIGPHAWPESQRLQHIAELSIIAPVTRLIESKQLRVSFLINVEVRDEVIPFQR